MDLKKKMFIAKSSTADQALVRCSQLSFEKAGFIAPETITNDEGNEVSIDEAVGDKRIKIGVFLNLNKFININSTFITYKNSELNNADNAKEKASTAVNYSLYIEFGENVENPSEIEYQATAINLVQDAKNNPISLSFSPANISEFVDITDDIFYNKIYVLPDAYHAKIGAQTVKNLIAISALYSSDANTDTMEFYVTTDEDDLNKGILRARGGSAKQHYDIILGYITETDANIPEDVSLKVFRSKFIMATRGVNYNFNFAIGANGSRMFVDSENGDYKTVIAIVRQ